MKLYITGGGQLNPPGFDGKVASAPLAMLAQAVTVQIGGQAADVSTAGDADGQVEGYVEVDVTVPQGIQPGNAPVVVSIAGNQSRAGVTLAVN